MGIERSLVQEILAREVYFESFSFKKHQKSHLIDISYRLELAGGVGGGVKMLLRSAQYGCLRKTPWYDDLKSTLKILRETLGNISRTEFSTLKKAKDASTSPP